MLFMRERLRLQFQVYAGVARLHAPGRAWGLQIRWTVHGPTQVPLSVASLTILDVKPESSILDKACLWLFSLLVSVQSVAWDPYDIGSAVS